MSHEGGHAETEELDPGLEFQLGGESLLEQLVDPVDLRLRVSLAYFLSSGSVRVGRRFFSATSAPATGSGASARGVSSVASSARWPMKPKAGASSAPMSPRTSDGCCCPLKTSPTSSGKCSWAKATNPTTPPRRPLGGESYWAYSKQLDYRLPLDLAKGKATRCAILAAPMAPQGQSLQISTSADGLAWQPAEPETSGSQYTISIPTDCASSGALHLRFERCAVSGFALLG